MNRVSEQVAYELLRTVLREYADEPHRNLSVSDIHDRLLWLIDEAVLAIDQDLFEAVARLAHDRWLEASHTDC